jgi:putative ABC transport system permease protein
LSGELRLVSSSTLRIAWRNLGRNGKRTAFALTAIGIGQLAFLITAGLLNGYADQFLNSITGPLIGHVQIHAHEWREQRSVDRTIGDLTSVLSATGSTAGVANVAPRVYAPVLVAVETEGFMGFLVGVDGPSEAHRGGLFRNGARGERLGQGRCLVGRSFASRNGVAAGDTLALVGQDVDGAIASGLFEVGEIISSTVDVVNNQGIVLSLEDAQSFLYLGDEAHEIVVHVENPDAVQDVLALLVSSPQLDGLEVLPWQEISPITAAFMKIMDEYLGIFLLIVIIAAAAGIANTMLMSTFERRHQFGMLLALGTTPWRLVRILVLEAVILGQLGAAAGTALGLALVGYAARNGIDYAALGGAQEQYEIAFQGLQLSSIVFPSLSVSDVLTGAVAVFAVSIVAIIWPSLHIAHLEPMEALRS